MNEILVILKRILNKPTELILCLAIVITILLTIIVCENAINDVRHVVKK